MVLERGCERVGGEGLDQRLQDLREYVDAGGLVAYGPNVVEVFRRTGHLVGRVLKGANPAEIPVECAFRPIVGT